MTGTMQLVMMVLSLPATLYCASHYARYALLLRCSWQVALTFRDLGHWLGLVTVWSPVALVVLDAYVAGASPLARVVPLLLAVPWSILMAGTFTTACMLLFVNMFV